MKYCGLVMFCVRDRVEMKRRGGRERKMRTFSTRLRFRDKTLHETLKNRFDLLARILNELRLCVLSCDER